MDSSSSIGRDNVSCREATASEAMSPPFRRTGGRNPAVGRGRGRGSCLGSQSDLLAYFAVGSTSSSNLLMRAIRATGSLTALVVIWVFSLTDGIRRQPPRAVAEIADAPVGTMERSPRSPEALHVRKNPTALNHDLRISEIYATREDWVEIHNPGERPLSLEGWYLTDDPKHLTRWRFPSLVLAPDEYRVVYASGQDRKGLRLHTNFGLDADGEFLALVKPDGTSTADFFHFPRQARGGSFSRYNGKIGFLSAPTPSAANASLSRGVVEPVHARPPRGLCASPLHVQLSSPTPGVEIHYTMDGSQPTSSSALYTTPIGVRKTTTLRAVALRPGYLASRPQTHTYILLDHVAEQPKNPAGFSSSWRTTTADYEMDDRVIPSQRGSEDLRDALTSLPTLSVVLDVNDLFGARGIYSFPGRRGRDWERAASLEWLSPDGAPGFQVDCGIRTHGGNGRRPERKKHSLRLIFSKEYGTEEFEFAVFPTVHGRRGMEVGPTLAPRRVVPAPLG